MVLAECVSELQFVKVYLAINYNYEIINYYNVMFFDNCGCEWKIICINDKDSNARKTTNLYICL